MDLLEHQVISTLKEGNKSAFEMLFRTYYRPLCNYAYSFLNDRDEAEEVVQSAFINIWDKKDQVEIQTSIKAYLYRMVRNSCLNVLKHDKVKKAHESHVLTQPQMTVESGHDHLLSSELERRIAEAMKALPEQCRLVFQLSRFEELKYAEIADQLNISVKTVENQIGKALRIMREQLKDYLPLFILLLNLWLI